MESKRLKTAADDDLVRCQIPFTSLWPNNLGHHRPFEIFTDRPILEYEINLRLLEQGVKFTNKVSLYV